MLKHYSRPLVKEEVSAYCRSRWVALEGGSQAGRVFLRYGHGGEPLKISSPEDFEKLLISYKGVRPRAVYGSINIYSKLERSSDLDDPSNIASSSPVWDIDGNTNVWGSVVEAAKIIVNFLESKGVERSIFLKWSGQGCHVHIHERAFSRELLSKHNPLDIAFSAVEYSLRKLKQQLSEVVSKSGGEVKVENEIDLKRVFTAPLSLHRNLNLCCVCFKPNAIDSFDLSWASPSSFRHDRSWREYAEGEADALAEEALAEVGGYRGWPGSVREVKSTAIASEGKPAAKIGRFQVMALLQAARYYLLTGDLERAKSFGLNRAIFYAWAKHHARGVRHVPMAKGGQRVKEEREGVRLAQICGEEVFVDDSGWFTMGGAVQTPKDYDRQVALNIASAIPYEKAWSAALDYLKSFPPSCLQDQQKFFSEVYKPVRDNFLDLAKGRRGAAHRTLDELFK